MDAPQQPEVADEVKQMQEQMKALIDAFTLFDVDGSGFISVEELDKLLKSVGQDLSSEELTAVVDEVDSNKTGSIEFKEFVRILEGRGKKATGKGLHKELMDAFQLYDKSGDGKITPEELREALNTVSDIHLSEEEVEAAIKEADKDGDGKIGYAEFLKVLSSTQ